MRGKSKRTPDSIMMSTRLTRRGLLGSGLFLAGSLSAGSALTSCVSDDRDAESPDDQDVDADAAGLEQDDDAGEQSDHDRDAASREPEEIPEEWPEDFDPLDVPELDLETMETETAGEILQVRAYENTWVGQVTDELFIAFSLGGEYPTESDSEVVAYACDSDEVVVYLTGEMDDDEAVLDDCVDKIELALVDDEIVGTITLEGQEPMAFTTEPATGDAGLYGAEVITFGDIDVATRWIVLDDGQQRGGRKCRNPWTGDCMWCPMPK